MQQTPTPAEIEAVKANLTSAGFKGTLSKTTINGDTFIYRSISRGEHQSLRNLMQNAVGDEFMMAILGRCIVWPLVSQDGWDEYGAGVVPSLFSKIELASGRIANTVIHFAGDDTLLAIDGWEPPTTDEVEKIRKAYEASHLPVYQTAIGKFHFIYRAMTGKEFKAIDRGEDGFQEAVLEIGVLWPSAVDWDGLPGLLGNSLQDKIYLASGMDLNVGIDEDEVL